MSVSVSVSNTDPADTVSVTLRPCRVQIQARQAIGLFDELIAAAGGRLDREAIDAGADRVRRAAEVFGRSIVQRDNKLAGNDVRGAVGVGDRPGRHIQCDAAGPGIEAEGSQGRWPR